MEENLLLVPAEEMPQTDEPKKREKKVSINILQENLLKLMARDKVTLAEVQKETGVAWGSLYSYYKGSVSAQLLDINVKEIADFFDVSCDFLAFGIKKYKFDTFDRMELYELKDKENVRD